MAITRLRSKAALVIAAILFSTLFTVAAGSRPADAEAPPVLAGTWGGYGTGQGRFDSPWGVALDDAGNVYVADMGNHRIQKFDADGAFLLAWDLSGDVPPSPRGVAVDAGIVFVTDADNDRVDRYTTDGVALGGFGTSGTGDGQFDVPVGIAADDGYVYVTDSGNDRVERFDAAGQFLSSWGVTGTGEGQFDQPYDVAVDGDGNVFVADSGNHRVQRFTSTGEFVLTWGRLGTGDLGFNLPYGVAVDAGGSVYVTDTLNARVKKFTADGEFVTKWGRSGNGPAEWLAPFGVAVAADGTVYVSDMGLHRMKRFTPAPQPDGRIRLGSTGNLVGDDTYNTTGVDQTRRGTAAIAGTVTYFVSVQNDALFAAASRLRGTASTNRFRVKYSADGTGITGAVVAGTYTTPVLAPGATITVKVRVTVLASAPGGSSLDAALTAKSDTDPSRRDTVRFVTRRS